MLRAHLEGLKMTTPMSVPSYGRMFKTCSEGLCVHYLCYTWPKLERANSKVLYKESSICVLLSLISVAVMWLYFIFEELNYIEKQLVIFYSTFSNLQNSCLSVTLI